MRDNPKNRQQQRHAEEDIARRVQVAIRTRVLCASCRSEAIDSRGMSRGRTMHYYRCTACGQSFQVVIVRIDSSFTVSESVNGLLDGDDIA